MVKNSGVPVMCCGQKMTEIIPGTTDAAVEKHVPVYEVKDNKIFVKVGSVEHPMLPEHYIERVSIQTKFGNQRKMLNADCRFLCVNGGLFCGSTKIFNGTSVLEAT